MEEINPWLDPDSGKHKNKKSVKPEKVEKIEKIEEPVTNTEEIPQRDDKFMEFLNTLVEDSLKTTFSKQVEEWADDNMGKDWLQEFIEDVNMVKDNILNSSGFPSHKTMVMLKYIFLLQQK